MKPTNFKRLEKIPKAFWQNRAWYRKQFSWHLHTLFPQGYAAACLVRKHFKFSFKWAGTFIGENGDWFWDEEDLKSVREAILTRSKFSKKYVDAIKKQFDNEWKRFIKVCKEAERVNWGTLSNEALLQWYENLFGAEVGAASWGYITDSFLTTGNEDWLQQMIVNELKEKVSTTELQKIVETLTQPMYPTFINEEKRDLLKIGVEITKEKELYQKILQGNAADVLAELEKYQRIKTKIQQHAKDYYWLENNYWRVHILRYEDFVKRLVNLIHVEKETKGMLKRESLRLDLTKKEKEEIYHKYHCSEHIRNIIYNAEVFTKIQDTRKQGVMLLNHFLFLLCEEVCKRRQITMEEALCTIAPEVEDILIRGIINKEELHARMQKCFMFISPQGYALLSGKDAEAINPTIFYGKRSTAHVVRGVVACKGKVTGKVRVITTATELSTFQQDEILITNNTTPEFVPLMKKAKAIVTEQGGITCHAAIVSRELGVPCIIGTKIATIVFKTGDIVEVDAENGVVRKIR